MTPVSLPSVALAAFAPKSFEEIIALRDQLLAALAAVIASKAEVWKTIPFLALQADGHSVAFGRYESVYCEGYWQVNCPLHGGCIALVDCATGELLLPEKLDPKLGPEFLMTIFAKLAVVDADVIAARLKAEALQLCNYLPADLESEDLVKWREGVAKRHSLAEIYCRPPHAAQQAA